MVHGRSLVWASCWFVFFCSMKSSHDRSWSNFYFYTHFQCQRMNVCYWKAKTPGQYAGNFPCYMHHIDTLEQVIYGLPSNEYPGLMKVSVCLIYLSHKVKTQYLHFRSHMQSTFFCFGKFLKWWTDNQYSSITKGSIYSIKHIVHATF